MNFSLRVCRHCRKPVSLQASTCPSCHKALMDPKKFQFTLVVMAFLLVFAYSGVAYGALKLQAAKQVLGEQATCEQPFYSRGYVPEGESCAALCTNECTKRDKPLAKYLLISTGYSTDRTDVQVSCECTCGLCR